MDDKELVERLLSNDEAAFNYLWDGFYPRFLRFAMTLVHYDQDTAEDLVQEAFTHCLERLDQFEFKSKLSTWLMRIIYYKALHVRRNLGRHVPIIMTDDEGDETNLLDMLRSNGVRQDEALSWKEAMLRYREVLEELKDEERTLWVLRQEEGLSYEQVVEVLGRNENTWRITICRIKEKISDKLAKCGTFIGLL